ncbi:cyclin-SDS [Andrographis paniculata]|uniref:cyclin-SDS n=1 Tax=Andrographis paniculata TaxID=175694 RepID=UPI0021E95D6D|nr:cyclin-SDS [Andrographis paniculata]
MKRKLKAKSIEVAEDQPLYFVRKQIRSRQSRRRRLHISPIVAFLETSSHITAVSEVSCDSSIASVSNQKPPLADEFRRIVTRTYYRKHFKERNRDEVVELSDNSCVESCSGVNRELKSKNADVEELEGQGGDATKSEVSSVSQLSYPQRNQWKVKENDESVHIALNQVEFEVPGIEENFGKVSAHYEAETHHSLNCSDVSLHSSEKTVKISESRATAEELPLPKLSFDIDLACSEQFSNGGIINDGEETEEHNSSLSEIFHVTSDSELDSSEYTPCFWSYASGSQFSEKSIGDESSSPTFELFRQFKQLFCRSAFILKACEDHNSCEANVLGVEDEEYEEMYTMMRKRERRQKYVHDYAEEYHNTTDYGELIIQQRLHMVHWIVEQSTNRELQMETMFLGVNLLDRFFSQGYFKSMRHLQIAGVACLTLATRIEENQPDNCVRKRTFHVGSSTYSRCEVVAMEWLIQEVLSFKCILPTSYNFLWFYLKASRANDDVEKTAKYLAVLTLMGHQQLCYWPSTIAAGLVILAAIAANQDASCHRITAIHARLNDTDLPQCLKSLAWLVKYL